MSTLQVMLAGKNLHIYLLDWQKSNLETHSCIDCNKLFGYYYFMYNDVTVLNIGKTNAILISCTLHLVLIS